MHETEGCWESIFPFEQFFMCAYSAILYHIFATVKGPLVKSAGAKEGRMNNSKF